MTGIIKNDSGCILTIFPDGNRIYCHGILKEVSILR